MSRCDMHEQGHDEVCTNMKIMITHACMHGIIDGICKKISNASNSAMRKVSPLRIKLELLLLVLHGTFRSNSQ